MLLGPGRGGRGLFLVYGRDGDRRHLASEGAQFFVDVRRNESDEPAADPLQDRHQPGTLEKFGMRCGQMDEKEDHGRDEHALGQAEGATEQPVRPLGHGDLDDAGDDQRQEPHPEQGHGENKQIGGGVGVVARNEGGQMRGQGFVVGAGAVKARGQGRQRAHLLDQTVQIAPETEKQPNDGQGEIGDIERRHA